MSGIEVAGLVLGALPILIEAIDSYRSGVTKLKSGFRKRKVVEDLGRALAYQKYIIEAITRNVLAQCGCDNVAGASDAQLRTLVQDKQTQEMVDDFLGPGNAQVFSDALVDCMAVVRNATIRLASLVPTLALVKNDTDVRAILDANAAFEKGRIQLFERLSVVFNLGSLRHEIEDLDRLTNLLDKFARNVTTGHQPGQMTPSRKATKLAKALQVVRQNAVHLHSALTRQWATPCHQRHELKVFLEDRMTEPKPKQAAHDARASCFKVVFVAGMAQPTDFWHETLFHIESEDLDTTETRPTSHGPRVQLPAPQQPNANPRLDVPDICAAIAGAACRAHSPVFYLAGTRDVAMTLHTQTSATTKNSRAPSITLQKIFQDRNNQNSTSPLPWKWRMVLALKVASSFLQFVRTPWVQPSWSARNIHIPYTADGRGLDLKRPFLSADFSRNSSPPVNRQARVKEDLLELGILLLEIWQEVDLETEFAQQLNTSNVSFTRRTCATQWLEDLEELLPDQYSCAAKYCVLGLVTPDLRASDWDHPDLWKSVCENVIDPLSKVR